MVAALEKLDKQNEAHETVSILEKTTIKEVVNENVVHVLDFPRLFKATTGLELEALTSVIVEFNAILLSTIRMF
jgi:phage tail tube protein FII